MTVRLIAFGDSIFEGWDGHEDIDRSKRIPETIGKINGWDVTNKAVGGTQFSGNNSFDSFTAQTNFFAYDIVLVGFGVNDWCYPSSLDSEQQAIEQGIRNIRATNPDIPIVFELPTEDFRKGSTSLDDKNSRGWSQNDLCDLILRVANQNGCTAYDWRSDPLITYANHTTTLGDGQVHPTQATMDAMAQRLAPVVKAAWDNRKRADNNNHDDHHDDNHNEQKGPVQLVKLTDPFKIGDVFQENSNKVVQTINQIYDKVSDISGIEEAKKVKLDFTNTDQLNRELRNSILQSFTKLRALTNDLIDFCNSHGFIDDITGMTPHITIEPPRQLDLGEAYQNQYNQQWNTLATTLNRLLGYVKNLEEGD